MKKIAALSIVLACIGSSRAQQQQIDKIITQKEVTRIETTLSSDATEGRASFTKGNEMAAAFIAAEMKKTGLQPLPGNKSFMQSFTMLKANPVSISATVGGQSVPQQYVWPVSTSASFTVTEKSGCKLVQIKAGDNFMQVFRPYVSSKENVVILADTSFFKGARGVQRFLSGPRFPQAGNMVLVFTPDVQVARFSISVEQALTEQKLANVVGYLPGKSKKNEFVIFSGHYDHLGYGKPNDNGDSLYNGANDDASGITAMLMLAKYYRKLKGNERSIIFTAFAAEEIGGYGSRYFSEQMNPATVAAMFNIEMIGTDSKWGNNSAYITGYEKTDMGKILEKNLEGSPFKFYPDPYPQQQLFYRSDNATLARQGVPAHTISTSKMDSEPHYHQASDAIETLDMQNMTEVIKSIAISAKSIIAGKDTPTRVDTTQLR